MGTPRACNYKYQFCTNFYAKSKYKLSTTLISAVQDSGNLAFQQPTFQSSPEHPPSLAVDGNKSPNHYHHRCTHTAGIGDHDTWWLVDLQQVHRVSTVKITNRGDCCGECACLFIVTEL